MTYHLLAVFFPLLIECIQEAITIQGDMLLYGAVHALVVRCTFGFQLGVELFGEFVSHQGFYT